MQKEGRNKMTANENNGGWMWVTRYSQAERETKKDIGRKKKKDIETRIPGVEPGAVERAVTPEK